MDSRHDCERFGTFLDRSKGYNNRGSSRAQFLHFAERIEVTSTFDEAGKTLTRHFFCYPKTYITEPSVGRSWGPIRCRGASRKAPTTSGAPIRTGPLTAISWPPISSSARVTAVCMASAASSSRAPAAVRTVPLGVLSKSLDPIRS